MISMTTKQLTHYNTLRKIALQAHKALRGANASERATLQLAFNKAANAMGRYYNSIMSGTECVTTLPE